MESRISSSFLFVHPLVNKTKSSFLFVHPFLNKIEPSFLFVHPLVNKTKSSFLFIHPLVNKTKSSFLFVHPFVNKIEPSFLFVHPLVNKIESSFLFVYPLIDKIVPLFLSTVSVFNKKSFLFGVKILILRTKKRMEPIRLKKISVDDIYVSILTKRRVTDEEGWTRMEPVGRQIAPTGSMVMDAVAKALAGNCGLTARDLAKAMGTTTKDLHAVFRLLTGMPTVDFLKQYRQKRACEWLACTDLTATKIAPLSGYVASAEMTHYFKKYMKCTPMEYRQLHRPKNFRELYEWETKS